MGLRGTVPGQDVIHRHILVVLLLLRPVLLLHQMGLQDLVRGSSAHELPRGHHLASGP